MGWRDRAVQVDEAPTTVADGWRSRAIPVQETPAQKEPGTFQKIAQTLTTPIRGYRGLGVGAQRLIEGDDLAQASSRAAEAVRPGYQPKPGEKIGSAVGEMVATAPMFAAAAPARAALGLKMLGSGLTSGALTSLQEASDRGDINVLDAGVSAAIAGSLPIIAPTVQAVVRAIRPIARVGATTGTTVTRETAEEAMKNPNLLKQYEGTAKAVGEKVVKIQDTLVKQHQRIADYMDRVRAKIGFREPFSDSLKRLENEGFEKNTIQDIAREYKILRSGKLEVDLSVPGKNLNGLSLGELAELEGKVIEVAKQGANKGPLLLTGPKSPSVVKGPEGISTDYGIPGSGLPGVEYKAAGEGPQFVAKEGLMTRPVTQPETFSRPKGVLSSDVPEPTRVERPGMNVKKTFQIPDKLRLRELYRLRQKLDHYINFPTNNPDVPVISGADDHVLKGLRKRVNTIIEEIPGGKTLRMADKAFSLSRSLYDDLQKKLSTQGKAEEVIQRILKGGDIAEVIGTKGDTLRLLQDLERKTKQSLIEPVRKELAAKNLREMKAVGPTGIPAEVLGPENVAKGLGFAGRTASLLENPIRHLTSLGVPKTGSSGLPSTRSIIQSIIDGLTRSQLLNRSPI